MKNMKIFLERKLTYLFVEVIFASSLALLQFESTLQWNIYRQQM